jgi:hypothetical protein
MALDTMPGTDSTRQHRILIHDLDRFSLKGILGSVPPDIEMVAAAGSAGCVGCFGCWIKTPGICVQNDEISRLGARLGECRELIYVSRLVYGGLSPDVKAVADRLIPYILPFFDVQDGRMLHRSRYPGIFKLSYFFYKLPREIEVDLSVDGERPLFDIAGSGNGSITCTASAAELGTMRRLANANARNFGCVETKATFVGDKMQLMEVAW